MSTNRFMRLFMLLGMMLVSGLVGSTAHAESPWSFKLTGKGLAIQYDGVPITWKSTLYVVKPGWTGVVYNQGARPFKVEEKVVDGKPVYIAVDETHTYRSQYKITTVNDNTLEVEYTGKILNDDPAEIECNLGYFNANLFANRDFKAVKKDGTKVEGKVQVFPKDNLHKNNEICKGFETLVFDTRIGEFTLDMKTDRAFRLFDARRDPQNWAKPVPLFWCGIGVPAAKISKENPLKMVMTLTVKPEKSSSKMPTEALSFAPVMNKVKLARTFPEKKLLVVPQPKNIAVTEGKLQLNDKVFASISGPAKDLRIVRATKRILSTYSSIEVDEPVYTESMDQTTKIVISNLPVGKIKTNDFAIDQDAKWFTVEDGYKLSIDDQGITIVSASPRGAFYGLHTLRQIIARNANGVAMAQKVVVKDWPTMAWRGAHWFPSRNGVPFHKKLIQRIMAGEKMNYAVIQVDHSQWLSYPKLADKKNAVLNDDLRTLVELCRENFIEPIPLLNVPGHGQWIFQNGQNKDICEDPDTPYAYCTKNPKTYEFIQTLMEEAIEMFKPRVFHLGHDEVTMRGRFPNPKCPYCGNETGKEAASRLVANHLNRLVKWLDARGIQSMIWGDMMLHKGTDDNFEALAKSPEAARYMRDRLPESTIVADWHYNTKGQYPSLNLFKGMGNDVIACTWFEPMNVYLYTKAAKEAGAMGIMQTTWCGYYPTEYTMERDFYQFTAFILAAEYSWSDRTEAPADLPYEAADIYNATYEPRDLRPQTGYTVDLKEAQTIDREKWMNFAEGWNIATLPRNVQYYDGVQFDTTGDMAVVIGNSMMSPANALTTLTLDMKGVKAKQLMMLNGSVWSLARDTAVIKVTFNYTDGTSITKSLATEVNSGGLMQNLEMRKAVKGWTYITPEEREMHLWITELANPKPEKAIKSVKFTPGSRMSGWCLAGLTVLE